MLSVLLCVVLVFAFAGCQKSVDPKQAYQQAAAKSKELKSTNVSVTMDFNGKVDEQSLEGNVSMDFKSVPKEEDNMDLEMKMNMKVLGVTVEIPMYYTDGYLYMEAMGQKIKAKMDLSKVQSDMANQADLQVLSQDFFKEITPQAEGDATRYTFTGDPEKLGDIIKSLFNQLGDSAQESVDYKVTKADGSFVIDKNGYISEQTLNMVLSATADGQTGEVTMNQTIKFNQPGETVTIEFPNFTGFTEVDSSAMESMFSAA